MDSWRDSISFWLVGLRKLCMSDDASWDQRISEALCFPCTVDGLSTS